MKKMIIPCIVLVVILSLTCTLMVNAGEKLFYGELKVQNGKLSDASGNPVQLRGMSSHGLQWEYAKFMNPESILSLRDNWKANVVRAAMYTAENGYIQNPSVKTKVMEIADAAIRSNMYVIIDWHILSDANPNIYKTQAKTFFSEMAAKYGNDPHVIFEICNEPNGGASWDKDIKPYAEELIKVIRQKSNNIILVGTGTWSQDIHLAAQNPLQAQNIMYSFHFYAGTHSFLKPRVLDCIQKGLPIFVSEWGTCDASGNGGFFPEETKSWLDLLDQHKISWVNWSLADKPETASALKPGANAEGKWSDNDLTASGLLVKQRMSKDREGGIIPWPTQKPTTKPTQVPSPTKVPVLTPIVTPAPTSTNNNDNQNNHQGNASFEVKMKNASTAKEVQSIQPIFEITNQSTSTLNLSEITLRYYYTLDEKSLTLRQNIWCDHAGLYTKSGYKEVTSGVTGKIMRLSTPVSSADHYAEVGFANGTMLGSKETIQVQIRFSKENWTNYDQGNDYSFSSQNTLTHWNRIGVYKKGSLVYGSDYTGAVIDGGGNNTNTGKAGDRYFKTAMSTSAMIAESKKLSKEKVKEMIRGQVDEHWSLIQPKFGFKTKEHAYGLFIGMATRESTLDAGLETGTESAHAFGPLQTAETAYSGANPNYMPENDVPEMIQYPFKPENFYDPAISVHMGIRKMVHFANQAQKKYQGKDILRYALIGFNTGWIEGSPESWVREYADEIAALGGWYMGGHLYDGQWTWTGSPNVNRSNPWGWYAK